MNNNKLNLAFYTYFYGNDDNSSFIVTKLPTKNYDCYYYTNNLNLIKKLENTGWIVIYDNIPINDDLIKSTMDGKKIKIMPHKYEKLNNYDYLCFYDNKNNTINVSFVENIIKKYFIENNFALAMQKHPFLTDSKHILDEFSVTVSTNQERYNRELHLYAQYILNQVFVNNYNEYVDTYVCCTYLIRNMRHPIINILNETYYEHIKECGIQDQISFFFARQKFEEYIHIFDINLINNITST